ncbi:hypothetical protein [Actinocrispum sp. NPDC049592]|uniref:hypothetical protein n=1 Tax=Actinocrispum sp. NPDC049592 TaxID=3154835 RepID=UPI00344507E0
MLTDRLEKLGENNDSTAVRTRSDAAWLPAAAAGRTPAGGDAVPATATEHDDAAARVARVASGPAAAPSEAAHRCDRDRQSGERAGPRRRFDRLSCADKQKAQHERRRLRLHQLHTTGFRTVHNLVVYQHDHDDDHYNHQQQHVIFVVLVADNDNYSDDSSWPATGVPDQ